MVLKLCLGTYFRHSRPFMALSLSIWLCKFTYIKITTIAQNLPKENFKLLLVPFENKTVKSFCLPCLQLHWHWALHHRWSAWRSARWPPWWYQGTFHHLYSACHSFQPGADCSAWLQLGSPDESMREPGHMTNTQQKNYKKQKLITNKFSCLLMTFCFLTGVSWASESTGDHLSWEVIILPSLCYIHLSIDSRKIYFWYMWMLY